MLGSAFDAEDAVQETIVHWEVLWMDPGFIQKVSDQAPLTGRAWHSRQFEPTCPA